jgi:hypothetical protein
MIRQRIGSRDGWDKAKAVKYTAKTRTRSACIENGGMNVIDCIRRTHQLRYFSAY